MEKILIIYGPRGGYTEIVAASIKDKMNDFDCTSLAGSMVTATIFNEFTTIIFGIATLGNESWSSGRHDIDINNISSILKSYDFKNKKVALFGLGNSVLYPAHFCDDLGVVEEIVAKAGAKVIGYTSSKNYTYKESKAERGDKFCGLALDQDTEHEKTDERINNWIDKITLELKQ